jgi:hypothetical protein
MRMPSGLRFNETMAGFVALTRSGDFEGGFEQGRAEASLVQTYLTIEADDLDRFIADPPHSARISGTLVAPILSQRRLTVIEGSFKLLVPDPTRADSWNMRYAMTVTSDDGHHFQFEGHKVVNHGSAIHAWPELTTLYTTLKDENGHVLATGILHITMLQFLRLMRSMTVLRGGSTLAAYMKLLRFRLSFVRMLLPAYGPWPLGESVAFLSKQSCDSQSRLPPSPTTTEFCHASGDWDGTLSDDVWLKLTRYLPKATAEVTTDDTANDTVENKLKGPVMLAPGLLMSTAAFVSTTTDQSLTEHLLQKDYDVWLFDYRASIDLPSARSDFTLDDVAQKDWPTAVARVLEVTRADNVQAVAHCMGSLTLQMAMLSGKVPKVTTAVCSQVTVQPVSPFFNRWKSDHHVSRWLQKLGFRTIQPETIPDLIDRISDLLLRLNPFIPKGERCTLAECRWITAFCGPTHRHAQLNLATHRSIVKWFGVGDLTALDHVSLIITKGKAVDHEGRDEYLPHVARMADRHILFLAGTRNRIFLPESSERTMRWLQRHNNPAFYARVPLHDYAHLDCFIGRNAATDVFPIISDHLDQHP